MRKNAQCYYFLRNLELITNKCQYIKRQMQEFLHNANMKNLLYRHLFSHKSPHDSDSGYEPALLWACFTMKLLYYELASTINLRLWTRICTIVSNHALILLLYLSIKLKIEFACTLGNDYLLWVQTSHCVNNATQPTSVTSAEWLLHK